MSVEDCVAVSMGSKDVKEEQVKVEFELGKYTSVALLTKKFCYNCLLP